MRIRLTKDILNWAKAGDEFEVFCWDGEDRFISISGDNRPSRKNLHLLELHLYLSELEGYYEKVRMSKVVHCKRDKYDVYIGRPSKWGNPFTIGKDGTRDEVVEKYKEWVLKQPELMKALPELEGKILGCWCSPKACHGDVLVSILDKGVR